MINNRQNGRRRGRGGGNNGGGQRQGGQGRHDSGNRIDSRARGNAAQLLEKYKNLAADAQRQGDRVNTEYYLQFADHYFRVLADQRGRFEDQQPRRQQNDFDMDGDDDFGDEGEPIRAGEQLGDEGQPEQQQRRDRGGNGYGSDRSNGSDRNAGDRNGNRRDRQWEPRGDRPQRAERDDRGFREERDRPVEIAGQHRADPPSAGESLEQRAETVLEADAPAPRRRGRPRRDAAPVIAAESSPAEAFEADRLPPAIGPAANDAGDEPKPRRRRIARPAADVPSAAE